MKCKMVLRLEIKTLPHKKFNEEGFFGETLDWQWKVVRMFEESILEKKKPVYLQETPECSIP